MNNYIIEGNIDFFAELEKDFDNDENDINNTKLCLLTKERLSKFNITLKCGHTFNYVPLYQEISIQKNKKINNKDIIRLKKHQFKCPYCRNIENKLIPYVDFPNVLKISGVNSNKAITNKIFQCNYQLRSGKRKGEKCAACVSNHLNYVDEQYFCNKHYKIYCKNKDKDKDNGGVKCIAILKSGKRKGQHCNCSKIFKDSMCKRHFNASLKANFKK